MQEAPSEDPTGAGGSEVPAATVLREVVGRLERLNQEDRARVIAAVMTFFRVSPPAQQHTRPGPTTLDAQSARASSGLPRFSDDRNQPPKEFLLAKAPGSDVERVACLAFYLAHYRSTATFTTADISVLNTEAAQSKFANPSQAIKNADRAGLVTYAGNGTRQLSAAGEQFVMALPDREAATELLKKYARRRRTTKRSSAASPGRVDD